MLKHPILPVTRRDLIEIALTAGNIMKVHFAHFGMKRETKSDTTPCTIADTAINAMVIEQVRKLSAEVDIVGEEESSRTKSPWQLVIDPIDGTFPYTWGMPISTFMAGLLYEGKPVLGVIYDPFTGRMYSAAKGKGALMNATRLQVSNLKPGEACTVGYASWKGCPFNMLKVCQYLEDKNVQLINLCSIGYMEAAVATGEFAGTVFPATKYHDTAPGHVIVEEAGGMVTDIFGEPLDYSGDTIRGHLMSNGHIHQLLVDAVKSCN